MMKKGYQPSGASERWEGRGRSLGGASSDSYVSEVKGSAGSRCLSNVRTASTSTGKERRKIVYCMARDAQRLANGREKLQISYSNFFSPVSTTLLTPVNLHLHGRPSQKQLETYLLSFSLEKKSRKPPPRQTEKHSLTLSFTHSQENLETFLLNTEADQAQLPAGTSSVTASLRTE